MNGAKSRKTSFVFFQSSSCFFNNFAKCWDWDILMNQRCDRSPSLSDCFFLLLGGFHSCWTWHQKPWQRNFVNYSSKTQSNLNGLGSCSGELAVFVLVSLGQISTCDKGREIKLCNFVTLHCFRYNHSYAEHFPAISSSQKKTAENFHLCGEKK